jgi:MFS transporter, SHS family, lactate transporter
LSVTAKTESGSPRAASPRAEIHALVASFLGWTLDAFDFFVVVFLVDILAARFGVSKADIIWTLTLTLATRPIGAFLFGWLADRYGRRVPLMANVLFYSIIEMLCGFAPNYSVFLILRTLYGIGMGGEWGVGASLAMETVKPRWRGIFSGILQSGYPIGYLLAAVAARLILPVWGWRAMFWAGATPALLALYIRSKVPESAAWQRTVRPEDRESRVILKTLLANSKTFAYLVVLMTLMMFLSHGTQDLYPDFLKTEHHLTAAAVSYLAIFYNIGAVAGSLVFGQLSQKFGRRRSMIAAAILSLVVIPLWALSGLLPLVAAGAFLMQMGVQGAWGIIPAHLTEISPDTTRSLVPGLAYQLGILFAAPTNTIEYALGRRVGYGNAMAIFESVVIVLVIVITALGPEKHGKDFLNARGEPPLAIE